MADGMAWSVYRLARAGRSVDRIPVGGGRDFPNPSSPALKSLVQRVPCISRGQSGRSVVLTTHVILMSGCEWVSAIARPLHRA